MNEKLTREQRDWIVAEAAANFRHHGVFRLKLFEETLNAHTEPEDEPKLITDEMEADILGMFHRETPKEMHARLEKELGHKISFEQEDSDEHVFCPTCKAEVYWVKGWYDCDYCGQLKEHPLMDTAEDEGNKIALRKIKEFNEYLRTTKMHRMSITDWLDQQEDK